jgi:hypothetical protein
VRDWRVRAWPTSLAITEGAKNAMAGRWTSLLVLVFVSWVSAAAALANVIEVGALAQAEKEWVAAGAYVVIAEPGRSDGGEMDARKCDALARVRGIEAAFAVIGVNGTLGRSDISAGRTTRVEVSTGAYEFFGVAPPPGASVLATDDVLVPSLLQDRDRVGLVGQRVGGESEAQVVVEVLRVDGAALADDMVGAWMVAQVGDQSAVRCYVKSDAAHIDAVVDYLPLALRTDASGPVVIRPRLSESAHGRDFEGAYADRQLASASVVSASVFGLLWGVLRWVRRARLAIYATFGAHRRALVVLQVSEWLSLSVPALVWSWSVTVCLGVWLGVDEGLLLTQASGHVLVAWAFSTALVIGVGLLPVGTLLDALKDRS